MFITEQSRVYFQTKYKNYSYLTLEALFWFKIVPITIHTAYSLLVRKKLPIIFPIVWTIAANVVIPNPEKWFFRIQQQKQRFMNSFTKFKKYTYSRMTFDQFTHCFDIARVSAIQKAEKLNQIAKNPEARQSAKQNAKQLVIDVKQTLKNKNELLKLKDKLKEDVKQIMREKLQEMKETVQSGKNQNTQEGVKAISQETVDKVVNSSQTKSVSKSEIKVQPQVPLQSQTVSQAVQAKVYVPQQDSGYKEVALDFFTRYFKGPKVDQDAAILGTYFLMRYSLVGTLRNFGIFL